MRRLCLGAAVLIAAALFSSDARAGATVDLLFVGKNGFWFNAPTTTVGALPGDTLTMAVVLRNDQPLTAVVFSVAYDLDGDDELDVVTALQWSGVAINKAATDFFQPLAALFPTTATFVGPFQGVTTNLSLPGTIPPGGGYQMGTIVWTVNGGVNNDGVDIIAGILTPGIDHLMDAAFNDISDLLQPGSAAVNLVPEPSTASLLGLGLLGVVLLRRHRPSRTEVAEVQGEGSPRTSSTSRAPGAIRPRWAARLDQIRRPR